jgi:hypothetical protein
MYHVIAESLPGQSKEARVTARPSIEHCHTEKARVFVMVSKYTMERRAMAKRSVEAWETTEELNLWHPVGVRLHGPKQYTAYETKSKTGGIL